MARMVGISYPKPKSSPAPIMKKDADGDFDMTKKMAKTMNGKSCPKR